MLSNKNFFTTLLVASSLTFMAPMAFAQTIEADGSITRQVTDAATSAAQAVKEAASETSTAITDAWNAPVGCDTSTEATVGSMMIGATIGLAAGAGLAFINVASLPAAAVLGSGTGELGTMGALSSGAIGQTLVYSGGGGALGAIIGAAVANPLRCGVNWITNKF